MDAQDFVAMLQADLDAATSNLGIAQQQVTDYQAKVDQLTSDIQTLQGYLTNAAANKSVA